MSASPRPFVTLFLPCAVLVLAAVAPGVATAQGSSSGRSAQPPSPSEVPPPSPSEVPPPSPSEVPPPSPSEVPPPDASPPRAMLDYTDGMFLLRSAGDNIVLTPGGRGHIDSYVFAGPGVARYQRANGTGLHANMFFRRLILELGGVIRKKWFFWVGGNFATTPVDASQAAGGGASVYDAFVGYEVSEGLRIFAGQYNVPFTMENVTSSRWLDLMERPLAVRTLGAPTNKDLGVMLWGNLDPNYVEAQLGLFGGDGMNRPNIDDRLDGMGRVVVRPLAGGSGPLTRLHAGGSFRFGSRDPRAVMYDAPTMSTPGGYAYWSPGYGSGATETRVIPADEQLALAGELYVPLERFDVKSEVVYVHEGRREALASARAQTLRQGTLSGVGGYVALSYWPLGTPRVNGHPAGSYGRIRIPKDRGAEAPFGLQVVARAEVVRLKYDGDDRTPGTVPSSLSIQTRRIEANALQLGATYWATKHVRLTAEYSLYQFLGMPPNATEPATNQAAAPGAKGTANDATASVLHEISFRVGLAF